MRGRKRSFPDFSLYTPTLSLCHEWERGRQMRPGRKLLGYGSLRATAPGFLLPAALDRMSECRVAQGCARAATCTSLHIVLPSRDIHYVPGTSLRASCPPATYTTSL